MSAPRPLSSGKPYKSAAPSYYRAGWVSPLPVRKGQKEGGLPTDRTGRGKPYATKKEIKGWMESRPADNICLRMMPVGDDYDVIGIDVDDYMSKGKLKEGGKQLRALVKRLGPLPATWISTNRGADNVSGIRFFRAPAGLRWRGKADKDIDIISPGYRYAVVYPSWHPEGRQYEWLDPKDHAGVSGQLVVGASVPDPALLPLLPEAWVEELTNGGMQDDGQEFDMDSSVDEIREWAATTFPRGEGEPCQKVEKIVGYWDRQIEEDASSHDKITSTHWNLACMLAEGHSGVNAAVSAIEAVWVNDTVKARGKRGVGESKREIFRSGVNALRKIKAEIESGKRRVVRECSCQVISAEEAADFADAMEERRNGNSALVHPSGKRPAGGDASMKASKKADLDIDDFPTYGEDLDYFEDDEEEEDSDEVHADRRAVKASAREDSEEGEGDEEEIFDHTSLGSKDGFWPNGKPGDVKPKPCSEYDMTDRGNALHWLDYHRNHVIYIGALNDWIVWTGKSWRLAEGSDIASYARIERRQRHYADQLYRRAMHLQAADDPDAKAALAEAKRWDRWADRSGNLGPIKAAVEYATNFQGMDEHYLNSHNHLFATMNGTVDLDADDANRLRPTNKDDLITLNTGCDYINWDDAVHGEHGVVMARLTDEWSTAVRAWLPDESVRRYVQMLAGYTLHGSNFEKLCVFLYGGTNTGKSTFLNAIMNAMGQYATVVDLTIFKERATNPALVYALPKRLITMSEGSDRNQLHADVFKRLTGGDRISAELKYSNERVERVPSFVPWVATNIAPNIPGADLALVQRIRVIPFNKTVGDMKGRRWEALTNSPMFAQVVLSWMVEGWNMLAREGEGALKYANAPMGVLAETQAFAAEFSDLSVFAKECLVHMREADASAYRKLSKGSVKLWPDEWVSSFSEVYDMYYQWAKLVRLHEPDVLSKNAFSRQLKGIGYEATLCHRDGHMGRFYLGVKMTPPPGMEKFIDYTD